MTPHRYRKVSPRVWRDEKFARLTPAQKLLYLYAITGPQSNRIGLGVFSPAMAAEDLGFDAPHLTHSEGVEGGVPPPLRESFAEAFAKVRNMFDWGWDPTTRVLFIPKWFVYNPPEAANNLKGNLTDLAELPQTPLMKDFAAVLWPIAEPLGVPLPPPLREWCSDPSPTPCRTQEQEPEQEQEQEQEQENTPPAPPSGSGDQRPARTKTKKTDPEADPRFDQFWRVYPRKVKRQDAAKAFAKLNPPPELLATILAAVDAQQRRGCLEPRTTSDGRSTVPHPTTWLNGQRWADEIDTPSIQPPTLPTPTPPACQHCRRHHPSSAG